MMMMMMTERAPMVSCHRRYRRECRAHASDDENARKPSLLDAVKENFFLIGVLGVLAVAGADSPVRDAATGALSSGNGNAEKYAISALFFIAGLGLDVNVLKSAALDVKLNAFIHGMIFIFPPAVIAACAPALIANEVFDERIVDGLFVMSCLPTTVGSGVAFTQTAGGNFSAALLNSMSSNLLGIFLTPFMIHAYLGVDSSIDPVVSSSKLFVGAFVPVIAGILLRQNAGVANAMSGAMKAPSKLLSDVILLGIIARTFVVAETSEAGVLDLDSTLRLVVFLLAFLVLHKGVIYASSSAIDSFTRQDRVAALYMGSHKTLAFGLPLIATTFQGNPDVAAYLLPLVVYHPIQILASSLLVPIFKAYVSKEEDGL
jgi:solute carrier family 10 (sodium/bile acid cotransporter), member 7